MLSILAGSHNIFNGDLKLILGLIWTLVQKYQLRMIGKLKSWYGHNYNAPEAHFMN